MSVAHVEGENFGHFLPDIMLPIFAAMAGFGAVTRDIQLLRYQVTDNMANGCDWQANPGWTGKEGWVPDVVSRPNRDHNCKVMYKMLTPGITTRPIVVMGDLFNQSSLPVCFAKILLGTPMLSDDCDDGGHGKDLHKLSLCNYGRMEQFWNFRCFTKVNLGVDDLLPTKHRVVIWQRADKKRALQGLEQLGVAIHSTLGVEVTLIDWASISIEKQLHLIGTSTVHITGVGGGSYIGLFLPRGATSIRLYPIEIDFGMDHHIFNFLGYVHTDHRRVLNGAINHTDVLGLVHQAMRRYETLGAPFESAAH